MRSWTSWVTFLLASALSPSRAVVHEELKAVPLGWSKASSQVSSNSIISLQVALNYQNLDQLESLLASVSTPGSPTYGKYLDIDGANEKFAPSKDAESAVMGWLSKAGASNVASDGSMVTFSTTIEHANTMLNASFLSYTNGKANKLRTLSYSVPEDVQEHIDLIYPTVYFDSIQSHAALPETHASTTEKESPTKRQLNPACQTTVLRRGVETEVLSPLCVQQLYNTLGYKADAKSGSDIAFGSFLNESASYSDLAKFEAIFGIPSQNFTTILINGGVDDQNPLTETDGEANLDAQNIVGVVDGLPVREYITGGSPPFQPDLLSPNASENTNEPYLPYYQYLLSKPNCELPYVISNSYGDHENTVPERYAKRVCNMIGIMGLRGRTIFESSGDEGVGAVCRDNSGGNLEGTPQFTPQFPATCPYVTGVGGTQFFDPEYAWNGSSGGFSFYFDQPWYQKAAVRTYLHEYINPEAKTYYASNKFTDFAGRGFPDISAHSLYPRYLTVVNGTPVAIGGTSAASPVVAGIFALLNDARFRAGLPPMGFVNPWLYGFAFPAHTLNDITEGAAVGCSGVNLQSGQVVPGAGVISYATWNATVGWDPVTGLGTPNFQRLKDLALSACAIRHVPLPVWSSPPAGGWGF